MNKVIGIDLSEDFVSDILYLGNHKNTANEFTVLFKWIGATISGGNFKLFGIVDNTDNDSKFLLDTFEIETETGEELRYSDVDLDALQIVYSKTTNTLGTAKVFIKMSEK